MQWQDVLLNSKVVLGSAIVTGFFLPGVAEALNPFIIPLLVVLMSLSMKDVAFRDLNEYDRGDVLRLVGLNYLVLTSLYLVAGLTLLDDVNGSALILLGLMPPAVGIISLTYILKGDLETSFVAEFAGYAVAFIAVPLGSRLLFGEAVSIFEIIKTLAYVLILPFILSRVLRVGEKAFGKLPKEFPKAVFNVCYGATFFAIVGSNRAAIVDNLFTVSVIAAIIVAIRFGMTLVTHNVLKDKCRVPLDVDYMLFSSFKNGGAAIGFTLLLLGPEYTLPLAVNAVIVPFHVVFLEWFSLDVLR